MKKGGSGQLVTPFAITVLVLCAAAGTALWLAYLPWRYERTKDELRKKFPSVRRINVDGDESLKTWYEKPTGPKPVVIDVRPQAEYDFSHLPGARHMGLSETPASFGIPEGASESFVICDAVGADSFPVAERLFKLGYPHVQVLEGGIFEWANHDLPLEGPSGKSSKVLPGKSGFASLLKRRARADQ
ncbi:MAG: rhodanese-like domain-containing protein [Chthoniobacteraceae bacterium]